MFVNELFGYNPWWKDKNAIEADPEIRAWNDSKLKWDPELRQEFKDEDYIYSLRGSRQVGKTTLIKLEIRKVLKKVSEWNVMYYSFELDNSPRNIVDVINEYLAQTKRDKSNRCFIYLDEISNVKNWQKAIKKLRDQGRLKNCTVVTTGSHSIDLRRATELLPGRRGLPVNETLDKVLMPMKFGEFVTAIDKKIWQEIPDTFPRSAKMRLAMIRNLADGIIDDSLYEISAFQNELGRHLETYLMTGGMPIAVNEFLKKGFIRDSTYQVYVEAVMGGLQVAGKDTSHAIQLLPNIIKSIGTPTSWSSLKKNSEIGSHHTIEQYVKTLSDMFVLSIFYRYNSATNRPKFDGSKKIFFQDHFFMHGINGGIAQENPYEYSAKMLDDPVYKGRLVEQVVADHCIRMAQNTASIKAGFSPLLSAFYWMGRASREVDFVVRDKGSLVPMEVKYQNSIRRDDFYGLNDFKNATGVNRGIMITRNNLEVKGGTALIPASLFLMLV